VTTVASRQIAPALAGVAAGLLGGSVDDLPVRVRAWDGSEAGPADAPVLVLRDKRALRRLLWRPNELGLAQAYITGEIDVEGDLADGLRRVWRRVRSGHARRRPSARDWSASVWLALRLGVLGGRPKAPLVQAKLSGTIHSRQRDRAAITYHYDLSNDFYRLILDPTMAYSCAYWTADTHTLEQAQTAKLDLICRKLALSAGQRLLDVGCGWGSLSLHAARNYGVRVTAVTLAEQQREFVAARAREQGVADRVEVRLQDYRDVADEPFDAVATIEMGEHVGAANYPLFAGRLHAQLRPHGRLLVQQMSRPKGSASPGGGAFIESYVAPDMHMRPVGETVDLLESAGLEVRDVQALREHYVRTALAWLSTVESRWADVVELVGEPMARVWRLYMVGGALTFEENRMGVDQILAVRPGPDGTSGLCFDESGWR
jgi:cyclopropane-fatty-acyl-phospholipid synthase